MIKYLIKETNTDRKSQEIYKFENGYGASVIRGLHTYGGKNGLYEVAVIKFINEKEWDLDYTTKITDDVIGYLNRKEVEKILIQIRHLKKKINKEDLK